MSLMTYNKTTREWEKQSSLIAEGIKLTDIEGKFKSDHVNGALIELADSIKDIKNDVKYIYENGTIGGGGGGGGGGSAPTITIDGSSDILVDSDEIFDIYFYFNSPNVGNGNVHLSYGSTMETQNISQGKHKWTLGPLPRGKYSLSITVQDKQGFWSTPAKVEVISGALELNSNFNDSKDFTLNEDIVIGYNIVTDIVEDVFLEYSINGAAHTTVANVGSNILNIGKLPFMGVSVITLKVYNSKFESNILKYLLVAADSSNIFVSTTFNSETIEVGKGLQLDYRISMKNQYSFTSKYYIDDTLIDTTTSKPGVNFWNIGKGIDLGRHKFKVMVTTLDGVNTAELTVSIEVVSIGFVPYKFVKSGLIAEFDASGYRNSSLSKENWIDTSGNNVQCRLNKFNYSSNGWIDDALVFSGKSYAEVDMKPFQYGVKHGLTIDVMFKTECVGNIEAKVLSCKNSVTPFQGFDINTYKSSLTSINTEVTSVNIKENKWTRLTYVIDRSINMMIIYLDGIISSASHLNPNDLSKDIYVDEFIYDGKLILGGASDILGNITNNSVSQIKNLRIYERALSDEEVLQNYIAGIVDTDEQLKVREFNSTAEGMPTIEFVGNFDQMDENAVRSVTISYNDPANPKKTFIKDNCLVSWQGTSSKNYPVKNYTMQLMSGGQPDVKYVPKDDWKPEQKWTLKANFMDSSGANNAGVNKFVHDFLDASPNPSEIKDPMTRSNPDGFPVRMILNGKEIGIYTWMIDRYSPSNYGFITYREDGTIQRNSTAVSYEIAVNSSSSASAFKSKDWNKIRGEFKHRYNHRDSGSSSVTEQIIIDGVSATVLKTGMHSELVELITWLTDATENEFLTELKEHFSVSHLIDYYIIAYTLGMVDSLGKNLVLSTWGKNAEGSTIWYPSFYDCDTALGLNNSGIIAFDAGLDMANGDYNTSESKLWSLLKKMFSYEIRTRYAELRMKRTVNGIPTYPILSKENVMKFVDGEVISKIGQKYYNYDARYKYFSKNYAQWIYLCRGTRKDFTQRWLEERFIYMDSVFEFAFDSKAVIRSYAQGQLTLRIKTYSPQWVLVSFSDTAGGKMKKYVGKERYTDFTSYVLNGTDNNIEIYGVDNVMYLDGIGGLDVRSLNLGEAKKLVEIDINGSNRIEEIELGNNVNLQKVLVNNCPNLGYNVDNRTLDLSNCSNLTQVDCSNTHIANVSFSPVGGVIESLNCSNTDITSFRLTGQEYLEGLMLDGCKDLNELSIIDCNGLNSINVANTKLSKVVINGCDNLGYIDISQTKSLKELDLSGCPNLRTLLMAGVSNPSIRDLDLTNSLKLETLDVSASAYINTLTFGQYTENGTLKNFNSLKNLICNNSAIQAIRYGKTNPIPTYLDLAGLTLNTLDFESCTNVKDIRNINLVATSKSPFNNCYNLESIQGNIKLIGSSSRAFYNCRLLKTLPTFDFSDLTSLSETFMYCSSLLMSDVTKIMVNSGISSKLKSSYRAFYGCTGLIGTIPSNTFSLCTNLDSITQFFYSCSKISGVLSSTLLAPMTKLKSTSYAFGYTAISGIVPDDLLRYNTELTDASYMFINTKISSVMLSTFFQYNTKLVTVSSIFYGCNDLQGIIHENIFKYNKELYDVAYTFYGCSKIVGTLPRNIFNNMAGTNGANKLLYIDGFFSGTSINGEIPKYISPTEKGLLDASTSLVSAMSLFYGCVGVFGAIPADLFKYNSFLTRLDNFFYNCTGISGEIPGTLLKNKTRLTSIASLFYGCTGLFSEIPPGLLDDCTYIIDVSNLFNGCSGLSGNIPKRVSTIVDGVEVVTKYGIFDNCDKLINASGVFKNCKNISSEIPSTLLMNASRVTSIDYMFASCYNLYGPVPADLLKNCSNLTSARYAFFDCVGLSEYIVDAERPYAIPEVLFQNCLNLADISSMFQMNGNPPHGSYLKGEIPPKLFINNIRLTTMSQFMYGASAIVGPLDSNLFIIAKQIADVQYAFADTGITSLGSNLFGNSSNLKNMQFVFSGCSSLTGATPEFWSENHVVKATNTTSAFRGATNLSNYNSIPALWK